MADAMAMRFVMETEPIPGARTRTYSRASVLEKHAHWGEGTHGGKASGFGRSRRELVKSMTGTSPCSLRRSSSVA